MVTARWRSYRPAAEAEARIERLQRLATCHGWLERATRRYLAKPLTRLQKEQVAEAGRLSTLAGHRKPWVSWLPVAALAGALALQDPAFIYLAVRNSLDVPDSAALLDGAHLGTFVAGSAALVITIGLISASTATGKALASLLVTPARHGQSKAAPEDEGMVSGARRLSFPRRAAIFAICGALTTWLTWLLHGFAEARFAGSAFGSSPSLAGTLVLMITSVPGMLVLLEAVACTPEFLHARAVDRWRLNFCLREVWSIRAERRILAAIRRAHTRAAQAIHCLVDELSAVRLSADAEVVEAAIKSGDKVYIELCDAGRGAKQDVSDSAPPSEQVASVLQRWKEAKPTLPEPRLSALWTAFWSAHPQASAEGALGESAPRLCRANRGPALRMRSQL
jgi:hypothetical protein